LGKETIDPKRKPMTTDTIAVIAPIIVLLDPWSGQVK